MAWLDAYGACLFASPVIVSVPLCFPVQAGLVQGGAAVLVAHSAPEEVRAVRSRLGSLPAAPEQAAQSGEGWVLGNVAAFRTARPPPTPRNVRAGRHKERSNHTLMRRVELRRPRSTV